MEIVTHELLIEYFLVKIRLSFCTGAFTSLPP